MKMNETNAQRRGKEKAELVRDLEKVTRAVVETEHVLATLRRQASDLRDRLLAVVAGPVRRKPSAPERVLAVARVVHDAPKPLSRAEVAAALGITAGNAGMRLSLALKANLVERTERGLYCGPGRADEAKVPAASETAE